MESLLPSEIARLVLGYLEEQKCDDAARSFLETCPHLQEIRTVISSGRRFSTRVNGLTLSDVLDIFCSINAIIQERLSKVSDCEQLKHCGDLPEQLRFLVDGSRGQRFKVTINVPQPSQTSGGSPIISSSMRKRHHSGSDRDRSKRAVKSHSNSCGKSSEPVSSQLSCNAVETTPLEHLPGNSGSENAEVVGEKTSAKFEEHRPAHCSSTVTEAIGSQSLPEDRREPRVGGFQSTSLPDFQELRNLDADTANSGRSVAMQQATHEKCTAATDTEELMRFTNTEVQTTPYDMVESETELTDEPVENLSLLTKELLNRTELQEKIAENINKAILPAEVSLRDVGLSESMGGEMNISAMTELNNVIKSVVTATESHPEFTKLLDDMFGPRSENETSPDEDADHQPFCTDGFADNNPDIVPKEPAIGASTPYGKKPTPEVETTEVPLKNRLRSSSSQQIVRPEEDRPSSQKPHKKEDRALEDLNDAAILSIINFNNKSDETPPSLDLSSGLLDLNVEADTNAAILNQEESAEVVSALKPDIPEPIAKDTTENLPPEVSCGSLDGKSSRKPNARKARVPKQKPKVAAPDVVPESLITEADMIVSTVPTVVYRNDGVPSLITTTLPAAAKPPIPGGYGNSQLRRIAPKTGHVNFVPPKPEPICLEVVTVPVDISKPLIAPKPGPAPEPRPVPSTKPRQPRRNTARATERKSRMAKQVESAARAGNTLNPDPEPTLRTSELAAVEKVTLYGENSAGAVLDETEIPVVQVEESIVSISGTGLSPFLKFNSAAEQPQPKDAEVGEKVTNPEEVPAPVINSEPVATDRQEASTSKETSYDVLMARTPRTLLKSRPKNHRLSKSTPRRRSHIRALNFNTPPKATNEHGRRKSTSESLQFSPKTSNFAKSVCRTSLFKSPPFVGASTPAKKIKNPAKDCRPCNIPIATRSPAPKLMGGWDKLTGVGMILVSETSSTSCSPVKPPAPSVIKSWDADLRSSLQLAEESQPKVTKKPVAKQPQKRRQTRKKTIVRKSTSRIEDCSSDRESPPPVKKLDAEPLHVSLSPQKAPPVEESRTVDVTDKPIVAPEKIEVATASESGSKEGKEVAGTTNETGAASKPPDDPRGACRISEVTTNTTRTVETVTSTDAAAKTDKTVKRKYAQLKTITTSVTKIERGESGIELVGAVETVQKSEFSRTYPSEGSRQVSHMPDMLDLETPRKLDNAFGIPPTPRLLSPSSSMTMPFGLQAGEDSGKMQSFITTPEFPPTPSIAVTPKQSSENTDDALKTQEPFSSAYYQPSSELKDPRLPRNDHSRHEMSLPLLDMMTKTTEACVTDISVQVAQGFQACTTSSKLEITQFEVIKENLSREETFKELKISTSAREPPEKTDEAEEISALPSIAELDKPRATHDANNSGSTVDQDSDSDSSASSSGSSTSSSSSSSSDSSATNMSAMMPVTTRYTEVTSSKIYTDTSNESAKKEAENPPSAAVTTSDADSKNLQIEDRSRTTDNIEAIPLDLPSRLENEASPRKVFALAKTEQDLKESTKETPAKDDSLLSEAVISETPSSSKAGIETLTNLSSKISAMITSEEREFSKSKPASVVEGNAEIAPRKSLPKIVSVETIPLEKSIALKSAPDVETLYSAMQSRNNHVLRPSATSDAKRSRELEEKRLRLVAKVKESENPPTNRPRIQRAVALPKGRKPINERVKSIADEAKDDDTEKELRKRKSSRIREIEESHEIAKKDVVEREQEKIVDVATKAETKKKSQMLKELFDESLTEEPETGHGGSREETDASSKTREEDGKVTAETRVDKEKKNSEVKSKDKPHLPERTRGRSEPETKTRKETAGQIEKNSEELPERIDNDGQISGATDQAQISENTRKEKEREECDAQRTATSPIESKTATKSKVDLVKRDLFSDEESSDQRTTRSRTRQTSDAHKSDSAESHAEVVSDPRKNRSATPKEDMPGVLKCLELVPTMKNDAADEEVNVMETPQCHADYHFIYDDAVPTKRRKRKFSSSELEYIVHVELSDDGSKSCTKLLTATPYEEIFNLSPPRKRRGPSKDTALKVTKYKRKDASAPKNAESIFKVLQHKPLASSSPVVRAVNLKVTSKGAKSPTKKSDPHQTDGKKKTVIKTEKTQPEHEKPNPKSRKRKASVSKESEQVDKKSRTTDPQLLSKLNDVDLDEFLTTLHGPA